MAAGIQSGENTHHQDQLMYLANLRAKNTKNIAVITVVSKENSKPSIL